MIAEQAIKEAATEYVQKKRSMAQAMFSPKRQAVGGSSSRAPMKRNVPQNQGNPRNPPCGKCGRPHPGVCKSGTNSCFQCGKTDHYARDCPMGTIGRQKPLAIGYQSKQLA